MFRLSLSTALNGLFGSCPALRNGRSAVALALSILAVAGLGTPLEARDRKKTKKAEKEYERLIEKFEEEKEREAFDRLQTIEAFGSAPCKKSVVFLKRLYESESNIAIHTAASNALGKIGSEDAIQALVTTGVPRVLADEDLDSFAAQQIANALNGQMSPDGEKWLIRKSLSVPDIRKSQKAQTLLVTAIAQRSSPDRFSVLTRELKKISDPELQALILESFVNNAKKVHKKAVRAATSLLKTRNVRLLTAAYQVLQAAGGKRNRKHFVRGLKSPYWQVRIVSVAGLAPHLENEKTFQLVVPYLDDTDLRVQISVIRALLERGGLEVIEPLIKTLSTTKHGRTKDDAADALARLTGRDLGPYAVQWESWWRNNKETLDGSKIKRMGAVEFSQLKAEAAEQSTVLYYGLRVLSNYVAFVIDSSQSMEEEYEPKGTKRSRKTTVRSAEAKKKRKKRGRKGKSGSKTAKQRITVARAELRNVVKSLGDGRSMTVIRFHTLVEDFAKTLSLTPQSESPNLPVLNGEVRTKVNKFIDSVAAAGQTNMSGGVKAGFHYGDVDTIFLLSDGAPQGGIDDHQELLRAVRRWNRLRLVKINVIGFDLKEAERKLVMELADQNFGVFVER